MNYRIPIGITAGLLSWWATLFATGYVAVFTIPGFREAVWPAIYDNNWSTISTHMPVSAIFLYCFTNSLSGWVTVKITKKIFHASGTAIPLVLYAITAHWFRLWNILPNWYNVLVVIMIPPLVYFSGKFAQ